MSLPRPSDLFDYDEESRVIAVVRSNPIRPGENKMEYIERLAVLAGLMKPDQAVLWKKDLAPKHLPDREPGEEG